MTAYIWVAIGSAMGGLLRYVLTRLTLDVSARFPWGTIGINVLGCFIIGFFGTLTMPGGRFSASENARLFVMVGLCGGFTTFSSFSLQTFDLLRSGAWGRALMNTVLSVVLCFLAVALGHFIAQHTVANVALAQNRE